MPRISKGFTLIELIVVMVVLGILAATAMPKFVDLKSDARIASLKALKGSIQSANSLARSKAMTQGVDLNANWDRDCANGVCVEINGIYYNLKYGYVDRSVIGNLLESMSAEKTYKANNKTISQVRLQGYTCATADFECEYDWCDCKTDNSAISGAALGDVQLFVPRGTNLKDTETGQCYLSYRNAQANGVEPTITLVTSGC